MIKVGIVDDHKLMIDGLKTIIDLEEDMIVKQIALNGEDAINMCKENELDVVLMDIRMPKLNGVEATRIIKSFKEKIKILVLTTFDEDDYIIEALANGADGYMLKDIDGDSLIKAIRDSYYGNYILPSNIAQKLASNIIQHKKSEVPSIDLKELTEREIEVARLLSKGFTNRQIASNLYLSEGTVKNSVSSIYSKIEISDRAAAAIYLNNLFKE